MELIAIYLMIGLALINNDYAKQSNEAKRTTPARIKLLTMLAGALGWGILPLIDKGEK